MEIIYKDSALVVCLKPPRVLSTDEPGGMPELVRAALGDADADVRTVHRLDRVVSGLMVLARGAKAASELSRQIRDDEFEKCYLAAVHGDVGEGGTMTDLMYRDKARKMSFVTYTPGKGVQEAVLDYKTLARTEGMSKVKIILRTGRTHQIRCQFASRGCPIVGDRKYGTLTDGDCEIALWSHEISFTHPETGERLHFSAEPPATGPWTAFE
ncbi:MAG: RluA family pseudouridine synthase [Oscillospiraceae bacterium]|nr:RluA family pseudouridine synthase [Oscillospiraceae bacterium]